MWPLYIAAGLGIVPIIIACAVKNKLAKSLLCLFSFFGLFLLAAMLSVFLMPGVIGAPGFWLPFVWCGGAFAVGMLFARKPFGVKFRRAAAVSVAAAIAMVTAVCVWPKIYGYFPEAGEDVNLREYMPFGDSDSEAPSATLVKSLGEESALKLSGDLPRLDGATALYPLYSAFVRAAYPEGEYFPYYDLRDEGAGIEPIAVCTSTRGAFQNLVEGYADIAFLASVSDGQRAAAESAGVDLALTPIGREAFVFFVNSRNSADNLSTEDIRRIYSGGAADWSEVGGGNGRIRAYQRPEGSGSQTALKSLMGGTPLAPAPQEDIYDLMMGMYKRVADYRNYKNSLGYSFLFYLNDMIGENKIKFLSVDGIAPTRGNIANGTYPLAGDFYAVTAKRGGQYLNPARTESIDRLVGWILSPQGQFLVGETGYVPIGAGGE